MITLKTISYIVGITVAISIFIVYSMSLSFGIEGNFNEYNRDNEYNSLTEEEILNIFRNYPAYQVFYEIHPDAVEELRVTKHRSELQLGKADLDKGSYLTMNFNISTHDFVNVRLDMNCKYIDPRTNDTSSRYIDDVYAEQYIRSELCFK